MSGAAATAIRLYDTLPLCHKRKAGLPRNIVAMAVQVRNNLVENPQRTQTAAGNHFEHYLEPEYTADDH
jgi:hypothetical protein